MLPSGQIAIAAGQIPDKFNKIAILARMAIEVIRLEFHFLRQFVEKSSVLLSFQKFYKALYINNI